MPQESEDLIAVAGEDEVTGDAQATRATVSDEFDVSSASDKLLDRLLYKGVLPRYAFPTDVVTFHVFDLDKSNAYQHAFEFTPTQSLNIALTQYAPGKRIWVAGKEFISGALYSVKRSERFEAWQKRKLYFECSVCRYALTTELGAAQKGERRDCAACGGKNTFGPARTWLRPPGFAHPVGIDPGTGADERTARSYATRAKLDAPASAADSDWTAINDRVKFTMMRKPLLVTNRGPREEGYTYCTTCGLIEPTALKNSSLKASHPKPYPDPKEPLCASGRVATGLVLGTDFITDVLLIGLRVTPPLRLMPGNLATDVALRTASEALAKAACQAMEVEETELQAEFRPALTDDGKLGIEAEIYLYDTLPGGAGFSEQAGNMGMELLRRALDVLSNCPANCDRSCYRCLRSYKNKFEHELIDRHVGAALLRYLLDGTVPVWPQARADLTLEVLFDDLVRQDSPGVRYERRQTLQIPGLGAVVAPILAHLANGQTIIIDLGRPMAVGEPNEPTLAELKELGVPPVLSVDELLVRRNLPRATTGVLSRLGVD
jgi:Domain of unknown function (DUF1998)